MASVFVGTATIALLALTGCGNPAGTDPPEPAASTRPGEPGAAAQEPAEKAKHVIPAVANEELVLANLEGSIHRRQKGVGTDQDVGRAIDAVLNQAGKLPVGTHGPHDRLIAAILPAGAAGAAKVRPYMEKADGIANNPNLLRAAANGDLELFRLLATYRSRAEQAEIVASGCRIAGIPAAAERFAKGVEQYTIDERHHKSDAPKGYDKWSFSLAERGYQTGMDALTLGKHEDAEQYLKHALARFRFDQSVNESHEQVARCLAGLAKVQAATKDAAGARRSLDEAKAYLATLLRHRERQRGDEWEPSRVMLRERIAAIEAEAVGLR